MTTAKETDKLKNTAFLDAVDRIATQADEDLSGSGWQTGTYIYMKALFRLAVLVVKMKWSP